MTDQLLLIDLSGIAHQIYHVDTNNPDPSRVSTQVIARVRALASAHPHAAICCDSGKSWRAEVDPTYKAQRDTENRAVIAHQIALACDVLAKDGFPVWKAPGMEADDVIATAVRLTREQVPDTDVLIVTTDKDILQLVNERVSVKNTITGNVAGPAEVFDKFGVKPAQMVDLLSLMGDTSDNIKGADKIGKVIAARLLSEHGTLDALYGKMAHGIVSGVTPGLRTSLMEFQARYPMARKLVTLRDDVEIPFHEIAMERTAPPMDTEADLDAHLNDPETVSMREEQRPIQPERGREPLPFIGHELNQNDALAALGGATARAAERIRAAEKQGQPPSPIDKQAVITAAGPIRQETLPVSSAPVDFSQQLEPRSMNEAVQLAQRMFESRLFGAYGAPQAVLATILAGRELGIPAMASLRAFHIIEGKPQLSAGTIQSLVLKSGKAKYFRCTERTATRATFVTQRGDDPEMALSYTIEEGKAAWPKDAAAFQKSGWGRNPADMLVARASSKLARLVYPDVVSGLYAPEEMD